MGLIIQIVGIIGPICFIVVVGYVYALKRKPDLESANKINIELFTPMLIFSVLSQGNVVLDDFGPLILAGILVVLLPGVLSIPLAKKLNVEWKTFIPPMMFRNSGNLGLPLFVLAFGEQALPAAVILFIVENTLHFSLGMKMLSPKASFLRLIRIPMLQATVLGMLFAYFGWRLPQPLQLGIDMLGQIAIPLMLFALGSRLVGMDLGRWRLGVVAGVWAPVSGLMVSLPLVWFMGFGGEDAAMIILFSALPPAVLTFSLAERFQQEPKQVASIVLISNVVSVITIPIVLAVLL